MDFENVSLGVSGFEWFPNGKEFIVTSQASLRPTGWGSIPLYKKHQSFFIDVFPFQSQNIKKYSYLVISE